VISTMRKKTLSGSSVLAGSLKSSARISIKARSDEISFLTATISFRADRKSRIKEEAAAVTVPIKATTPRTLAAAGKGSMSLEFSMSTEDGPGKI